MEVRRSKFTLIATKFLAAALVLLLSLCIGRAANVWDAGGGGNRSINNAANWDDNTVPNLSAGNQTLTFATLINATFVFLNTPVHVAGLNLNYPGNIRFTSTNATNNFFTIGSGGIHAEPSGSVDATYTIPSKVVLSASQMWTIENKPGFSTTVNATNLGGAYNLTKTGSGLLELVGNITLSGNTTVSSGTLRVNANASSTTVNVQSGGTLGGNGTVGGVVLETGGTLAPGNSPGMLSVSGDATWQGGASYNWQVQALNSGPSQLSKGINWDFFSVNGTLNLSGLNTTPLNFNLFNPLNLNFQPGNSWAIAESMQGIRLNGGLLSPNTDYSSLFNINSTSAATLQIVTLADYNTLYLISAAVIPEPSQVAASLLLVSFAAGYWILKKRREARKITALRQSPPVA